MKNKYSLEYFSQSSWSFVLLKQNRILYKSKLDGLRPLIACVKKNRKEMHGAITYDKIVGKAAAILLTHVGVKEVWTPTISESGKKYLGKNKIKSSYKELVNCIKNREGNGVCPMERMSSEMTERDFIKKMLG